MSTPEWRALSQEVFRGKRELEELPALLGRARSLNAPAHETHKSIMFDWMWELHRYGTKMDPNVPVATLKALLEAGVDPHGGRPSFSHLADVKVRQKKMMDHLAVMRARPSTSEASFRYSLAAPFRQKVQFQHETNWLAKVIWSAREHPRLVSMVESFLRAGVHPHDQGPHRFQDGPSNHVSLAGLVENKAGGSVKRRLNAAWSAWPTALCAARLDVLEVLGQAAGPIPPPDWTQAVLAALEYGSRDESKWGEIKQALEWFTRRYPPTSLDCQAVLEALVPGGRVGNEDGLALWLSLPCAQLARADGPVGAPESFNPWACLGRPCEQSVAFHETVLEALASHPRWGNARAVMSCLAMQQKGLHGARAGESILALWVEDQGSDTEEGNPKLRSFRHRLFSVLEGLDGLVDPLLPAFVAKMERAPDPIASKWLFRNPHVWIDADQGRTPWHHGPRVKIQRWLDKSGCSPFAKDHAGNSGLACALVQIMKKQDKEAMNEIVSSLPDSRVDWGERVEGRTLKQWLHGSSVLCQWAPGLRSRVDPVSWEVALEIGDYPALQSLSKHRQRAGLGPMDVDQSTALVEAWLADPVRKGAWLSPKLTESELSAKARAFSVLAPWLSPELPGTGVAAQRKWLARCWSRTQLGNDSRPDMAFVWQLYDPALRWSREDLKALVNWAGQDITLGVLYSWEPTGPWAGSSWSQIPAAGKAALASAVLAAAINRKNPFGVGADYNVKWMEFFLSAFKDVPNIHEGASLARIRKTLALLEGPVSQVHQEQFQPLSPVVNSWIAHGRTLLLNQALPGPESAAPKLRNRF